jgi:UDPglucose--hexose-1-phosphate uridylyltransferase
MVIKSLLKPDGRQLLLYARNHISVDGPVPSVGHNTHAPNAHLRWHPLRGEWVAYALHRQHRTFLPPAEYNPLAPTMDASQPTELPAGRYDVAVFENLFPAFTSCAHDPPTSWVPTQEALGRCEVVVFTQDGNASLGSLPLWHLELILEVWADRYRVLGERRDVQYVYPFENRGVEVGVTLGHPHGQIYAYPFIPPIPGAELANQRDYQDAHGRGLLEDLVAAELTYERRILYEGPYAVAFVPVVARYPYEVWVTTRLAQPSLASCDASMRADLARALKTTLLKYDGLWNRPFPYVMAIHQAPTDGQSHPEAHVHVEFYPAYRMRDRLKFLAGSEIGAGVFTADTDPDDKAAELRAVTVNID